MKSLLKIKLKSDGSSLYSPLCALAVFIPLFPVTCGYIMEGGIITEWIARMNELEAAFASGVTLLFPTAEPLTGTGIWVNAMNSNLWFLLPALIYRLCGNLVIVYRLFLLFLQLGTFFAAKKFFEHMFGGPGLSAFFGILLYMTCPYRIYVCYDWANLSQAVAWMLLPLYAWAVLGLYREPLLPTCGDGRTKYSGLHKLAVGALTLAGMGYGDVMFFLSVAGLTLLFGVIWKNLRVLLLPAGSALLFAPGLLRLLQYLFLGYFQELGIPVTSIMEQGYRIGEFFSSYVYRDSRPGMGLGMLLCLLTGLWLTFVHGQRTARREITFFTALAAGLGMLSLRYFPWELAQRLGIWALKLISLFGTPALFFGLALFSLCIPAAEGMERISRFKNREAAFWIPLLVLLLCIGICIYQCNALTFQRLPLMLQ